MRIPTRQGIFLFLAIIGCFILIPSRASAVAPITTKDRGLYISPVRDYVTLKPGTSSTRSLTVANLTNEPMIVSTHIDRFSVEDRSYTISFAKVNNDWVRFLQPNITLAPYESHDIPYTITLPADSSPGGYYYTLYASSTIKSGSTSSTVQAAMLLYVTVDGNLVRTSEITENSLPFLVIGPDVSYSFAIKNTGNIHYFAYVAPTIRGVFYQDAPSGTSQLLMPGLTRTISNSIRSPLFPGVYRFSYEVTTDQGKKIEQSRYFLYLPLWSLLICIPLLFAIIYALRCRKLRRDEFRVH